jgi:DNA-binding transcriptional MerR regulator
MPRAQRLRDAQKGKPHFDQGAIPDKTYFRIGEVSKLAQTEPYVLRYWETEFPTLRPGKTPSGHRLYKRKDVQTIFEIKRLLYEEGFTIEGARKQLTVAVKAARAPEQKPLFSDATEVSGLRSVERELQRILTLLSRENTLTRDKGSG